jgi:hypothetical protein
MSGPRYSASLSLCPTRTQSAWCRRNMSKVWFRSWRAVAVSVPSASSFARRSAWLLSNLSPSLTWNAASFRQVWRGRAIAASLSRVRRYSDCSSVLRRRPISACCRRCRPRSRLSAVVAATPSRRTSSISSRRSRCSATRGGVSPGRLSSSLPISKAGRCIRTRLLMTSGAL